MFVLKYISRLLLSLMGWNRAPAETIRKIATMDTNQVLLLQHTSYWDFALGVLYFFANDLDARAKYIVVETLNTKYWYLRPMFHYTGCIFVPRVEGARNRGSTSQIIKAINADPTKRKIILISPNGSTKGATDTEWRTGWFYIAKGINAKVGTIGLNYHPAVRSIDYNEARVMKGSYAEEVGALRAEVASIYPKFPKESSVLPLTTPWQDRIYPTPLINFRLLPNLFILSESVFVGISIATAFAVQYM